MTATVAGMTARPARYPVSSATNVLRLLLLFLDRQEVRVSEAAVALRVAPSTAHRLLTTLENVRFVRQEPATRTYVAGGALLELGVAVVRSFDVLGLLRPILQRLSEELGETAHLVVLHGQSILFAESIETTKALRIGSRVGRIMPAACTAGGKAILATLPSSTLRSLYPDSGLEQMTPRSHGSLEALEMDLERTRERGYALNFGESEPEVAAVAMALPPMGGQAPAAITVSAPISRFTDDSARQIADTLREAISSIADAGATQLS
jgi:DNA-binding IclR family transcriptional regulator